MAARAIADALLRTDPLTISDLDLFEINEALAGVTVASTRELGCDPEIVNVNGDAIGISHRVGISGARLVFTLALELKRGVGGQGDALVIRVP